MRAADRMLRDARCIGPEETLSRAERILARETSRALPVVRKSTLIGVLDARDIARARPSPATSLTVNEIEGRLSQVAVGRLLPPHFTAVGVRTPLGESIRLMRTRRLTILPVVQGARMLGVLTEDVLLDLLAELLDDPGDRRPGGSGAGGPTRGPAGPLAVTVSS